MKVNMQILTIILLIILALISGIGCTSSNKDGEHEANGETGHLPRHEEGGGEGEEAGQAFAKNETYDNVRNGARLILNYDPSTSAFVGTVENTTNQTLSQVRVEVHLSNGTELGPTTPKDLAPGEKMEIVLDATGENFNTWSAHPEVGSGGGGESSGQGEGSGEHGGQGEGGEGGGEHGGQGEGGGEQG